MHSGPASNLFTEVIKIKNCAMQDSLQLGPLELQCRLIVGTGKYPDLETMKKSHEESGTQMVTVALRKIPLSGKGLKSIIDYIDQSRITLLPNTAGAHSGKEALKIADIAVSLGMRFLKIEVMGDAFTLLPDPVGTLRAVELIREKYSSDTLFLMVYTSDDPVVADKLVRAGADAVMPGGSPIGSGRGIANPGNILLLKELVNHRVPIILDAGVGVPSDASRAMEMGLDAVLMNSAIAGAGDPVLMAKAMKAAVHAGRLSYRAGPIPQKLHATASSPSFF